MVKVYIHTGGLSFENGAVAPLQVYHDLAKALGVYADHGAHYGDDSLEIPEEDWPIAQQLLIEARMLYRVHTVHDTWQNVLTEEVRQCVRPRTPLAA